MTGIDHNLANFKPRARIRERSPAAFGCASWTSTSEADALRVFFDPDGAGVLTLRFRGRLHFWRIQARRRVVFIVASTTFFFGAALLGTTMGWTVLALLFAALTSGVLLRHVMPGIGPGRTRGRRILVSQRFIAAICVFFEEGFFAPEVASALVFMPAAALRTSLPWTSMIRRDGLGSRNAS